MQQCFLNLNYFISMFVTTVWSSEVKFFFEIKVTEIRKYNTPLPQIIGHLRFLRFIGFAMHLDIHYV